MSRWTLFAVVGLIGCASTPAVSPSGASPRGKAATPTRRPNVVVILTDDQGSIDLHAYGANDLATPNLDALCQRGVRFTQFYAAAPVCSPSRAALLTGRTPHRAQLRGNVPRGHPTAGMPSSQLTMAELFRDHGYATALVGKWHLGSGDQVHPNAQGFDHAFGHLGGCIDNYSHFFYWAGPNQHDLQRNGEEVYLPGRFFPDVMVEEASRFIDKQCDQPFFLYFAMNAPHYPYQGDPVWLEHYRETPEPRRQYAAFVSTLDRCIGRLIDTIDAAGLRDDTIIVFQSDHGHSTEQRAFFGGGSAGPYRGAKFSLLEGGIRVPAVVSWPGRIEEGGVRHAMATACDWFPTLAGWTGATLPERPLDGRDISAVIKSAEAPSPHREFHWGNQRYWAVRVGDWKLVHNARETTDGRKVHDEEGLRLYDIAQDPGETTDLADAHPAVVTDLEKRHLQWWKDGATQ